ncbi:MAG: tripartite tricarboxylate transporter substrate binding protein [Reyranellaceae bacterium]
MRRRHLLAGATGAALAKTAWAQSFPSKPVRIVVPYTPGGTTDILARELAAKLQPALGQSVIIENRPGGGGTLGCELVARADPDGHTILMGHIGTLAINPLVYPQHSYDPVSGWTPIAYIANVPNVLAVHASVPASSVRELVALAKAKPGALAYGTGGTASASHLATAYFTYVSGIDLLHVPYKGTGPFISDLVAGQLQIGFTGAPVVMPLAKQGKLRTLAISSAKRSTAFPELPTIAESGYPEYEADQWYGITGPAGIDPAIVARLNAEINRALVSPEIRAHLEKEGGEPVPLPAEALGKHIAAEIARWRPVVKAANIRLE